MKREVFEILLNEYQELSKLRERSIKNSEETTRTFITITGLVAAAFSISPQDPSKKFIMLITVGIALLVGAFIYHGLILNNIGQTIYTRELNITRKFIIEKRNIEDKIFLPTNGLEPKFDNLGFVGEKFSKNGSLGLIRIINCFLVGILVFLLFNLIPLTHRCWNFLSFKISFGVIAFIIALGLHNSHHQDMVNLGENKWKEILKKKGLNK